MERDFWILIERDFLFYDVLNPLRNIFDISRDEEKYNRFGIFIAINVNGCVSNENIISRQ